MSGVAPEQTPLRVSIVSRIKEKLPEMGTRIRLKAVLRPPPGPVRPRGFDFARQAWFAQIGAVGFAISKVEIVAPPDPWNTSAKIERVRQLVIDKIKRVVSGSKADIAMALIVGEKSAIDKKVLDAIRAAGLAHMLAISGMHMALVSGTSYWVIRALLALSYALAMMFDVRKIAAVLAIFVASGYLALSGMGISTMRAFIMVSIMFAAILLGRRALSLHNVAVAALLILIFRPESLLEVGFQMSFASVIALVSFYENAFQRDRRERSELLLVQASDRFVDGVKAIFFTTLVASLAVAPIAIHHFHHMTPYSLIGNVLAIPVLTLLVMPMAVVGLAMMPLGLHEIPLSVMGQGNMIIIHIAHWVAGFADSRINVGTISLSALLSIVAGGLWLCLLRSSYRYLGLLVILAGLVLAVFRPTPFLLVERDGGNIVLIDGRRGMWPVSHRAGRYSLNRWKSAFAFFSSKEERQMTKGAKHNSERSNHVWRCDQYGCTAKHNGLLIAYSTHPGAIFEDCAKADILVATYPLPKGFRQCRYPKIIIDRNALKRNGAFAIFPKAGGMKVFNTRQVRGERPWTLHN